MDNGMFVANSYTGELYPVDRITTRLITKWWVLKEELGEIPFWNRRHQTIIDLLLAGF